MPILNYTTDIPVVRSIAEIQALLAKKGARSITQEYEGANVHALSFTMNVGKALVRFSLPVNVAGVLQAMQKDRAKGTSPEQAARCAWRILKDWIEAQMALIESGQAQTEQVFMPYAQHENGRTMFQIWQGQLQKQLTSPPSDHEQ